MGWRSIDKSRSEQPPPVDRRRLELIGQLEVRTAGQSVLRSRHCALSLEGTLPHTHLGPPCCHPVSKCCQAQRPGGHPHFPQAGRPFASSLSVLAPSAVPSQWEAGSRLSAGDPPLRSRGGGPGFAAWASDSVLPSTPWRIRGWHPYAQPSMRSQGSHPRPFRGRLSNAEQSGGKAGAVVRGRRLLAVRSRLHQERNVPGMREG